MEAKSVIGEIDTTIKGTLCVRKRGGEPGLSYLRGNNPEDTAPNRDLKPHVVRP